MNYFDQLVNSSRPHQQKAQIFLEEDSRSNTVEEAINILKYDGSIFVDYEILKNEYPQIVRIFLPSEDMRKAVTKLLEAGFSKFHGIDKIPD
jgi:hypothetical protein